MDELITKKSAVSAFTDLLVCKLKGERLPTWNDVYNAINDIPSAQPEIKTDENNHHKTSYDQGFVDACKMYKKKQPEIKTDGDAISRQAAIEVLRNRWLKTRNYDGIGEDIAEECEIYLKTLPSAQPDPCDVCKWYDDIDCTACVACLARGIE